MTLIRPATQADEAFIREIDFDTGFLGESMSALIDDRSLFEYAIAPFLPSSRGVAFVAESDEGIVGYAVASSRWVTARTAFHGLPAFASAACRWRTLSERDRRYLRLRAAAGARMLTGAERRFRSAGGARLHVNLLPAARGKNIGSQLLSSLFDTLRDSGVVTVHANSYQRPRNPTHTFWLRNGFTEFSRVPTSAWRDFGVDEGVDLVCYARTLR